MLIPVEVWNQIFQFSSPRDKILRINLVCNLFHDIINRWLLNNLNCICFVFVHEDTFVFSELIPDGTTFDINMSYATHLTQIKLYFPPFIICVNKQSDCYKRLSQLCPPYQPTNVVFLVSRLINYS